MTINPRNQKNLMFLGVAGVVVLLVAGLVYVSLNSQDTNPQVSMTNYRLSSAAGLMKPMMTDAEIVDFAMRSGVDILSFSYATYKEDLQNTRGYFTKEGWDLIQDAFRESGMLSYVVQNKSDVRGSVVGDAVILQQGVVDGVYSWIVQMPFKMVYHDGAKTSHENMTLTLRIQRSDSMENVENVGIRQVILTRGETSP